MTAIVVYTPKQMSVLTAAASFASRGDEEFRRLRLRDRIGHVQSTSGPALVGILLQWVYCMYNRRRMSRL